MSLSEEVNQLGCIESEGVKNAVLDFNRFVKTLLKENSIQGLDKIDRKVIMEIMDKYNIETVSRSINTYEHILYIHKRIFGEWE